MWILNIMFKAADIILTTKENINLWKNNNFRKYICQKCYLNETQNGPVVVLLYWPLTIYTILTLEQAFHICGVASQSHRKERT